MFTWEKKCFHIKVWYDWGWSRGRPTYSSMLKVTTCSKEIYHRESLLDKMLSWGMMSGISYLAGLVLFDENLVNA